MSEVHYFRSYVVTELMDTKELANTLGAAHSSIDPKASITRPVFDSGQMYVFNFGSIVFWNVSDENQKKTLSSLVGIPGLQLDGMCSEDFSVLITSDRKPQVEFNRIVLDELTAERAEVIAGTLAQSTTMEYYENLTEEILESGGSFYR